MNEHGRFLQSRWFHALIMFARVALGGMFIYAGIPKIADPAGFSLAVYNYHILPPWLVNITAIILPWIEVIAGTCLVLGLWIPGAALMISGLLFLFAVALGFNLSRGLDIACGCFSTSPEAEKITWWYLLRDSFLFASALLVYRTDQGRVSLSEALQGIRKKGESRNRGPL